MQLVGRFLKYIGGKLVSRIVYEEDADAPFSHWIAFDSGVFVAG